MTDHDRFSCHIASRHLRSSGAITCVIPWSRTSVRQVVWCRRTAALKHAACFTAVIWQSLPIQKTVENVFVCQGLGCSASWLLLLGTGYKYSYLLTYLLVCLLTKLKCERPLEIPPWSWQWGRECVNSFTFFQSILHWSVAVSTICRHSSRVVAFLQAVARPKFRGPRSALIAQIHVWLGLPTGRSQSGGTCRIAAASARWWSSRDELRAIWPKSHRRH